MVLKKKMCSFVNGFSMLKNCGIVLMTILVLAVSSSGCQGAAKAAKTVKAEKVEYSVKLTGTVPELLAVPEVADLKPIFCRATPIPKKYSNEQSGYTALTVGPDGKVYLGTARYCDYGYWIAFDPKDRTFSTAIDIRQATGEDLYDINTQGKTHTKLAVGPDGKIWGGTKQGHELFKTRPEIGEQSDGYPGGHLLSYDPATGVTEDYGVLRKHNGLMNCVIDHKRRKIYFKTEPQTDFIIYDMDNRQVFNKGRVGTWGRYMDMDAEGNMWILNHDGFVTKYDVEKDELIDYKVVVEGEGHAYKPPYSCVIGGRGKERGMVMYGGDHDMIQEFDLTRPADGVAPKMGVEDFRSVRVAGESNAVGDDPAHCGIKFSVNVADVDTLGKEAEIRLAFVGFPREQGGDEIEIGIVRIRRVERRVN